VVVAGVVVVSVVAVAVSVVAVLVVGVVAVDVVEVDVVSVVVGVVAVSVVCVPSVVDVVEVCVPEDESLFCFAGAGWSCFAGAPWSWRARFGVSAGRPVWTDASSATPPWIVPRSPGWIGR
jgi:hypothetical protein